MIGLLVIAGSVGLMTGCRDKKDKRMTEKSAEEYYELTDELMEKLSEESYALLEKVGEVEEKIVAQELFTEVRSQVRTLSSVEGVKQMVSFAIAIARNITERIMPNAKQ